MTAPEQRAAVAVGGAGRGAEPGARLEADAAAPRSTSRWIVSAILHGGMALAVLGIREPRKALETVAISVTEQAKKAEPETPPPPPPPPIEEAPRETARRPAARPAAAAAPPPAADAPAPTAGGDAPLLDLALGNGPGGFAVAAPAAAAPAAAPAPAVTSRKVLGAPAAAAPEGDCADAPTKPKPRSVPQPAYPESARAAGVSGKVRVEVSVDETGAVRSARVVSGLGHGLDEAALAAARSASFAPATRCGKPVAATFVIGMRFAL